MSSQADRDGLRNELIPGTVATAFAGSPFYRALYENHNINVAAIQNVNDLQALPVVTKDQLRTAGRAALCWPDRTPVSHIQNTTGTTGEQFFLYRSVAETKFIFDFYAELAAAEPHPHPAPVMLQLQLPHHGTSTSVPAPVFAIPFSVNDDHLIEYAVVLLRKEFDIPGVDRRVSILSGSQTGILTLTNYLLEHDVDCKREFGIKLIHVEGRYLTSRWRRVLREAWGAAISDKYSLAEVFGGAGWCGECEGFHFDPHVVPELIDFAGEKTLGAGVGVLLLTSLYPFVQLQPMIRYATGDIFALDPDRCSEPRFEFLGRRSHALFNPKNPSELWLTGIDIIEALDPIPEINRTARFRDLTSVQYSKATGRLRVRGYRQEMNGICNLTLKVEVSVPISLYPERRQTLEKEIAADLLARSTTLSQLVSKGEVTLGVDLVKSGTLGTLERITQLWLEEK